MTNRPKIDFFFLDFESQAYLNEHKWFLKDPKLCRDLKSRTSILNRTYDQIRSQWNQYNIKFTCIQPIHATFLFLRISTNSTSTSLFLQLQICYDHECLFWTGIKHNIISAQLSDSAVKNEEAKIINISSIFYTAFDNTISPF